MNAAALAERLNGLVDLLDELEELKKSRATGLGKSPSPGAACIGSGLDFIGEGRDLISMKTKDRRGLEHLFAVCAACEVRAECRDRSLARGDEYGIFGGLLPRERRALCVDSVGAGSSRAS